MSEVENFELSEMGNLFIRRVLDSTIECIEFDFIFTNQKTSHRGRYLVLRSHHYLLFMIVTCRATVLHSSQEYAHVPCRKGGNGEVNIKVAFGISKNGGKSLS